MDQNTAPATPPLMMEYPACSKVLATPTDCPFTRHGCRGNNVRMPSYTQKKTVFPGISRARVPPKPRHIPAPYMGPEYGV
eukprot:CAMPEP_0114326066 /NCGR_PEP_ID=MMETSP0059-20121206/29505_1 /TAXON_ID=36894 /ORGANISM="Pyramimonas parkeae, Strain CCMP726" /LENGTH=79 /DNA_ID=CAMNT_0001454973 /DNA_START=148 /DNA_END=387 /DNA_ORIENTATION=-